MTLESIAGLGDLGSSARHRSRSTRCCGQRSSDMTLNGWLQILLYLAAIAVVYCPARTLHGARVRSRAHMARSGDAAARSGSSIASPVSMNDTKCGGPSMELTMLAFSLVSMLVLYVLMRFAGVAAIQSAGPRERRTRSRVQYRRAVHHEHELAVGTWARRP